MPKTPIDVLTENEYAEYIELKRKINNNIAMYEAGHIKTLDKKYGEMMLQFESLQDKVIKGLNL